jgi:hypothetical protein
MIDKRLHAAEDVQNGRCRISGWSMVIVFEAPRIWLTKSFIMPPS